MSDNSGHSLVDCFKHAVRPLAVLTAPLLYKLEQQECICLPTTVAENQRLRPHPKERDLPFSVRGGMSEIFLSMFEA